MSMSWYPPGWEIYVDNPGYGELAVRAPRNPYDSKPLVVDGWDAGLCGPAIGEFLDAVTGRAVESETAGQVSLPAFITPSVARGLLPSLQRAVVLAVGGTERFDRTFHDGSEQPPEPYCVRCGKGTHYSPGELPSEWCEQHGHTAFGMGADTRWKSARERHEWRLRMWRTRRDMDARRSAE